MKYQKPDLHWLKDHLSYNDDKIHHIYDAILWTSSGKCGVNDAVFELSFLACLLFHSSEWGYLEYPFYSISDLVDTYCESESIWLKDGNLPALVAGISEGPNRDRHVSVHLRDKLGTKIKSYADYAVQSGMIQTKE